MRVYRASFWTRKRNCVERRTAIDPQKQFCHNPACSASGKAGQGNIKRFSKKEKRYYCVICRRTFVGTKGTPFYRLRTAAEVVTIILTLLGHGCPLQAIVAAFGFDERTIAKWRVRAGYHCQGVHRHLVQQGAVDLQHVQADELWVKMVGRRVWMAMAIAVPSRLWLGGVISPRRDLVLITALVEMIRSCAGSPGIPSAVLRAGSGLCRWTEQLRHRFPAGVPKAGTHRPQESVAAGVGEGVALWPGG